MTKKKKRERHLLSGDVICENIKTQFFILYLLSHNLDLKKILNLAAKAKLHLVKKMG